MAEAATIDPETLTPSQHARRERILHATVELASKGGYDAVQMRDVAERAGVALGTLYRYFPSKVHLLIATMNQQSSALRQGIARRPPEGDTPGERVLSVLRRATRALERSPQLTAAMLRALMFADVSAAREVDSVNSITQDMLGRAIAGNDEPLSQEQQDVARVISQVWQSSLLTWLTGRLSSADMTRNLETAVRLLLRDDEPQAD